jgi:acyl carrier protein
VQRRSSLVEVELLVGPGDTKLMEDLDADSLDVFQVLSEIEDELDLVIETDEDVQTIDQLVVHIEKAQAEQA